MFRHPLTRPLGQPARRAQPLARLLSLLLALAVLVGVLPPLPAQAALPTPAPAPGRSTAPQSTGSAPPQTSSEPSSAPPAPQGSVARSTVSGSILLDEDLSGAPSAGDRPVIGLGVRIAGSGQTNSVVTDGSGAYSMGGLPAGTYTVGIGLPPGLVAVGGTSRTVTVDGKSSARADFFLARAEKAPAAAVEPTPTPEPTATPPPTSTPRPLPTPVAAPGYSYASPADPGSSNTPVAVRRQPTSAPVAAPPRRPIITSLQGLRYAPGRSSPSSIEPVRNESSLWLGVPFITQLDGSSYASVNCGPASIAMVLAAFGVRAAPSMIRDYVNYLSGVYGTQAGTSLDHLGRVAREAGLETSLLHGPSGGYLRWSTDLLREQVAAGRPVITLVKYRALPGHGGSLSDWDHYIVIAGLSGNDFIYNDAAYGGDRGYGLLISPRDLERAWDYSSIPRHGMAVALGSGRPLPPAEEPPADGPSDDDLLAEVEASLGQELGADGAFDSLLFRRVEVDQAPVEPSGSADASDEVSFELGDFIIPSTEIQVPAPATSVAPVPPGPAPRSPDSPLPPLLLLAGLGVAGTLLRLRRRPLTGWLPAACRLLRRSARPA